MLDQDARGPGHMGTRVVVVGAHGAGAGDFDGVGHRLE